MNILSKIVSGIKRRVMVEAIRNGLIRRKRFVLNGVSFVMGGIHKSNLLGSVAANGFESYEPETVKFIKGYPWGLEAFYDIGANIGFYSILSEIFLKANEVVSVEAHPLNVEYLIGLKKENGFGFGVVGKAVDQQDGLKKTLYYPVAKSSSKLPTSASLINKFSGTAGVFNNLPFKEIHVETISLATLVTDRKGWVLIKLDIEGGELAVLRSSASLLQRDNIDWVVEILVNDERKSELFSLFMDHGYNAYLITTSGLVRENRPLTLSFPDRPRRTLWKNHLFTKRPCCEIKAFSESCYGYWI